VLQSRWLIFLPIALFALFAPQSAEASQVGLLVRGYQIDEIPPTKSDLAYPLCGSSVEPFINATWDYEQNLFGECGWDSFMLHYTGYLQIPEHDTIEFWIASDDGGTVKIGTEEFGVWQDQGCSATETGLIDIEAGTQPVDAWFYENGGGTCFMLAWNIDNTGWAIVQPEFFTNEPLTPETTSTLETTTTEATTTTSSTTTSLPTTTAAPQTTTTLPQTTSSIHPTSLVPETSTTVQTAQPPIVQQTLPPIPEPTTSVQTTEPSTTTTASTATPITTSTQAATTTSTSAPEPSMSVPEPLKSTTTVDVTPTTFVSPDEPITAEQFAEVLTALSDATPDQITEIVTTILNNEITTEQATQLVASVEILSAVTPQQAQQLFEQVEETQLSESMAAVIANALNDPSVPAEVKEAFEEAINIFGNDGFDQYVPVDSAVTVAVRRTIIAGTTILVSLPSPAPARRT
jgi:hypothetical protein